MTNDMLNDLWNSAPNCPAPEAAERLTAEFLTRLRRRRRFQAWWLGWTFLALAAVTTIAVAQLIRHGAAGLAGQWALWPMLVLPWSAAILFLRRFRLERVAKGSVTSPLLAALVAARASNAAERRRHVAVGALLVTMAPISALAIWQLHVAGKATADQAWSMGLVFGLALALGGGFVTVRYRRHLIPECNKIATLLRDIEFTETP